MIRKILTLIFLFTINNFAQTDSLQQSFWDEINLLLGVETGALTSFNENKLFVGRKQDKIALKTNSIFIIQPISNIQVGLSGFGITVKANFRGNFFYNGAIGYQKDIKNNKIFRLIETFNNYGIELTYDISDFFTCGLHYDKEYGYTNNGTGIVENPTPVILPGGYPLYRQPEFYTSSKFKQVKLVLAYRYTIKKIKFFSKLNFTLYSKPENNTQTNLAYVLLNDVENFGTANLTNYTTHYKKNPFNLQFELGTKFDFPVYPFLRFEYLNLDNLYKVYMFSLNLRFQIP